MEENIRCITCECHDFKEYNGHSHDRDTRDRGHWCLSRITVQYPNGGIGELFRRKYMTYKEFKNKISPEFCPRKMESTITENVECKVLKVKKGLV